MQSATAVVASACHCPVRSVLAFMQSAIPVVACSVPTYAVSYTCGSPLSTHIMRSAIPVVAPSVFTLCDKNSRDQAQNNHKWDVYEREDDNFNDDNGDDDEIDFDDSDDGSHGDEEEEDGKEKEDQLEGARITRYLWWKWRC
ncbi:hypothetical protein ElyMa_005309700 [Elysia marginata]|uniref:Uncharacterized protein n=1 Tax=Elysia marginata TaxID=1093978 RepID=A0AAV4JYP7_9GAST|nr:hypothetical protein ElyMa_005309700 [Elysia marginata]